MPQDNEANFESAGNSSNGPVYADELSEDCPPRAATAATGTFYAAHRAAPPDELDFRTAAARNVFPGANECKRRGNSIVASVEDARQLCRAYPDAYAYVSEGTLIPTLWNAAKGRNQEISFASHTLAICRRDNAPHLREDRLKCRFGLYNFSLGAARIFAKLSRPKYWSNWTIR
jgi:hypothetical protein